MSMGFYKTFERSSTSCNDLRFPFHRGYTLRLLQTMRACHGIQCDKSPHRKEVVYIPKGDWFK